MTTRHQASLRLPRREGGHQRPRDICRIDLDSSAYSKIAPGQTDRQTDKSDRQINPLTFTDRRERHKESQGQEDRQPETKRQTCRQIERERQRDKYIGYTERHRETEKQIDIQTKREGVTNRDRETPNGHAYRNSFSSVFVDSQCHIT